MKRLPMAVGALAASAACGLAQDRGMEKQKMKPDLEKLQGTWSVASLEVDGQAMPASSLSAARMTVKGSHFASTGMGAVYEGTIEIDEKPTPRTFDLKFTGGPEEGNTNFGIYELDGDTWRICLATRGPKRPAKFATQHGSGIALETLKRGDRAASQPEKETTPAFHLDNVRFEAVPELAGEWSMVSGTQDGHPMDARLLKVGKRLVEGSETSVLFGPQLYAKAKFTVDRSKTPNTIDYYNTQGGNAGKAQYGIYELSGGTLKICMGAPDRERPNEFQSTPGDGRTLAVWRKAAK
jgi:uncharacterized protein (TIGR03067 family)